MDPFLKTAVYAVIILSAVTILGAIILAVILTLRAKRPKGDKPKPEKTVAQIFGAITVLTGTLNAAAALWMWGSGKEVVSKDPGSEAVQSFFSHIEKREFPHAWDLIHPARKDEIKDVIKNAKDFGDRYQSTRGYENIKVVLKEAQSPTMRTTECPST